MAPSSAGRGVAVKTRPLEAAARQHFDRVLGDGLGFRLLILGEGDNE